MQAKGAYYALVEQQNTYQREETEEDKYENYEANEVVHLNRKNPDERRRRASTIASVSTSVWSTLQTIRNSIHSGDLVKINDEKEVKKNRIRQK